MRRESFDEPPPSMRDVLNALPPLIPRARVAKILGECTRTVMHRERRGELKSTKRPGDPKQTRSKVTRDSLVAFMRHRGLLAS